MQRVAFKMKLFKGFEEEYQKRHDELWEDMKMILAQAGVKDFSIFLDEESGDLFACLSIENASEMDKLPGNPIQKKWWAYMKDIMETNPDNSPAQTMLKEVFYLKG
ncbi:MAG: L-rhamnose mutarotase [Ferruginibacter sp.]